ncbi:MAG: hemerythrin domain-containing protein [Elusimicrobia bacterium]|nr:hemerythrin domain-containing protein [Elusimicrobiota bacterium]
MGPIARLLAEDHRRLDGLLAASLGGGGAVARAPFAAFRQGLLRHIGLEETVLLPAVSKLPAAPLALAAKLRIDHGALTNLLVPEPTREIVLVMRGILDPHNALEEGTDGFYAACDALPEAERAAVLRRLENAPELPLRPFSQRPQSLEAAKRAVSRAGFDWDRLLSARH